MVCEEELPAINLSATNNEPSSILTISIVTSSSTLIYMVPFLAAVNTTSKLLA